MRELSFGLALTISPGVEASDGRRCGAQDGRSAVPTQSFGDEVTSSAIDNKAAVDAVWLCDPREKRR